MMISQLVHHIRIPIAKISVNLTNAQRVDLQQWNNDANAQSNASGIALFYTIFLCFEKAMALKVQKDKVEGRDVNLTERIRKS
uniref:Uncharacterized protein n=1 Tax=Ascaris lumbricoides TaxID=6252 RepID=A0A0M3I2D4_ASCLU